MVEGEKNQVHCNKSDRKAHSMFPTVQPYVGVGDFHQLLTENPVPYGRFDCIHV